MASLVTKAELDKIDFKLENYIDLFQEYDKDLNQYIQTFSGERGEYSEYGKRFLLAKLAEKWIPLLGFNEGRISSDIREKQAPRLEEEMSMSLKDLLNYDDGISDWLIPNFLSTVGLYILAAPPKTGKTILLNFLIKSIAVSGEFMGRPAQTGNVLYIQLEENKKTMKKRALLSGFGADDEETSLVINFSDRVRIERRFDLTTDLEWLMRKIYEYKPKLVIIDSIRMAALRAEAGENTNEFGKLLYALQRTINFAGVCCVVVHHMNKTTGKNVDLIQRLSGHTSISAACDGIIGLMADDNEESREGKVIHLKTKPRDGTEMTIYYKLIKNERGLWDLEKIYEDTAATNIYTSKILRFLGQSPDQCFTASQIAKGIGASLSFKDFNESLDYLDSSELLKKKYSSSALRYALTSDSLWLINPQRVKDMVSPSVLDGNAIMRCKSKSELRILLQEWSKEREAKALAVLLPEERKRITELVSSWEYSIGEEVLYNGKILKIEATIGKPTLRKNKYKLSDGNEALEQNLQYYIEEPIIEEDIVKDNTEVPLIEEENNE